MLQAAYEYNKRFGIRIHRYLTQDHVYLDNASKMRNRLAEQVLSTDMLHLVKALRDSGEYLDHSLDSLIELLENTGNVVSVFSDKRPISSVQDTRLTSISDNLSFFNAWEGQVLNNDTLSKADKFRTLFTEETRDDVNSSLNGFLQISSFAIAEGIAVTPAFVNSDPIENHFCQQRGIANGLNTNPTLLQYGHSINAIILGQCSVSKKSNSGVRAQHYKATVPCSLRPKTLRM